MPQTEHAAPGARPAEEVKRKAVAGAAALGVRSIIIQVLAFGGNVALARLLVPADFGTVALGLAALKFATLLSDGGLGAGLVRRATPPARADLGALVALQLIACAALVTLVAAAGIAAGGAGGVIALMMCGLPLQALRTPGSITLQRALDFGPLAKVEVSEVLAYYTWGVAAVAAGFGVWGLAVASIVKAATGTAVMLALAPIGLVKPSPDVRRIRSLLRFGVRFQGVGVLNSARDDGINVGLVAVGGLTLVGLWAVVWRLLQIPMMFLNTLWGVSYPAMSQWLIAAQDPAPVMRRVVGLAAVAIGLIVTPLLSATPALIPALFGDRWTDATEAMAPVCVAMQINGPISVATAGYLFASGQVTTVLRVTGLEVLVWFGVTLPLIEPLGVRAVGLGFCAAALVQAFIFARTVRRRTTARLVMPLLVPFTAFAGASIAGWLVAEELGRTLPAAIVSALIGLSLYLAVMVLMRRQSLFELGGLLVRALRSASDGNR